MPPKLERCVTELMQRADMMRKYPDEKERRSHCYAICTAAQQKGGAMTEPHFGYTSLAQQSIMFEDPTHSWIHAMPVGKWMHPRYGEIEFTPERLQKFADNFNNRVRGTDLAIDYQHNNEDKAAGWVKSVENRDNGLWFHVEWTPGGAEAVKNREFRYFSPEYADEWEDGSGTTHENVLFGGGLTNRPFLKNLEPVNLSEFALNDPEPPTPPTPPADPPAPQPDPPTNDDEHEPVTLDEGVSSGLYLEGIRLRDIPQSERKGHPASDFAGKGQSFPIFKCEDVAAAARSLGRAGSNNLSTDQIKSNIISIAKRKGFTNCLPASWKMTEGGDMDELVKALREQLGLVDADQDTLLNRVVELRDFHDTKATAEEKAKKFAEDYPDEAKRLTDLEKSRKLAEAKAKIAEWANAGLPAVVHEKVKAFRQTLTEDGSQKFDEVIEATIKAGVVKLKENGSSKSANVELNDEIEGEIKKYMSEHQGSNYREALRAVSKAHPEWARSQYLSPLGGGE